MYRFRFFGCCCELRVREVRYLRNTPQYARWRFAKALSWYPIREKIMFVRTSGSFLLSKQLMSMERIPLPPDHCENNSEPVEDPSKSNAYSARLSILFVVLGTCVFLWGLGYKLSLYDLHEPSVHRVPEAKLLSGNEDRNATDAVRRCAENLVPSHPGSLRSVGVDACFSRGLAQSRPATTREKVAWSNHPCRRPAALLSANYLRPPPLFVGL